MFARKINVNWNLNEHCNFNGVEIWHTSNIILRFLDYWCMFFLEITIFHKEFHYFLHCIGSQKHRIFNFCKELHYFLNTVPAVRLAHLSSPSSGSAPLSQASGAQPASQHSETCVNYRTRKENMRFVVPSRRIELISSILISINLLFWANESWIELCRRGYITYYLSRIQ